MECGASRKRADKALDMGSNVSLNVAKRLGSPAKALKLSDCTKGGEVTQFHGTSAFIFSDRETYMGRQIAFLSLYYKK
jgi:hypothetical protein